MKIISLHLPKTAGTSFGRSLSEHFKDSLLRDYGDGGISRPAYDRNRSALIASKKNAVKGLRKVSCVHGHFLPLKYLLLATKQELTFVTWMRHPIKRMISHYNFWQRNYDPRKARPHRKQVIEEQWTLEQFCLSPRFRNIYSQYLWGFPLENFDFIGITEHYEEDLRFFSKKYLSSDLEVKKCNVAPKGAEVTSVDSDLFERIASYHSRDMALYRRALEYRRARMS